MALPAMRFRFAEDDQERYGDQWWTFDEAALTRLRAAELIDYDERLRQGLGLNVVTALASYHRGETRGALAVMWMARRLAGVDEDLDGFDPLVLLAETQLVPAGDVDPPASNSSSSPASVEE